jgi:recombination DNA repair RAD52 pathway protein
MLMRHPDPAHVFSRKRYGKDLSYISGWVAISEANAIFGFGGWDRQTLLLEKIF